jgi:hypothetical protein
MSIVAFQKKKINKEREREREKSKIMNLSVYEIQMLLRVTNSILIAMLISKFLKSR